MTKGEVNLLCGEIDVLLTDICKFLSDEVLNGGISENSKAFANLLIERSKVQLKAISKITSALDLSEPAIESYVDMQGPKVVVALDDPQEVYSDVSFEGMSDYSITDDAMIHYDSCPYDNLPAIGIKDGKSGFLYRKERFLFFDQYRKIFAAIQQSWFLLYINEHSLKPIQTFDLSGYNAKTTTSKEIKKREESFCLCSLNDLKTYQFTALTSKDMLQWVSAINRQSELMQTKRSLPPVPASKLSTDNVDTFETDSSNDYEPLTEYRLKPEISKKSPTLTPSKKPLPLPPRNTLAKSPPLNKAPSEESMGDYDCVGPPPDDSFSDENEDDAFYDNPTELKQKTNSTNTAYVAETNNVNDEDEIYDYLQDPAQSTDSTKPVNIIVNTFQMKTEQNHTKENSSKGKNKPTLKPKLLSFSQKKKNF